MGKSATIKYRLPTAELLVTGTVRRRHDRILDTKHELKDMPALLVAHAIELRHVADGTEQTLTTPAGWLRSYKGSFTFTADRRLTNASAEALERSAR